MEKLLHERLREHEPDAAFIFSGDGYEFSIMGHEADKLADEIERQYEPRKAMEIHDADYVLIKEGDKVWGIEDGCEYTVLETHGADLAFCDGRNVKVGDTTFIEAKMLTHDKPLFDVDGQRICEGDVLWLSEEGRVHWRYGNEPFTVIRTTDYGVDVNSSDEPKGSDPWSIKSKWVTHQEPDSLKKLIADMRWKDEDEWADRLEKLMGESCER